MDQQFVDSATISIIYVYQALTNAGLYISIFVRVFEKSDHTV